VHVGIPDQLTEVPQPVDGLSGVSINESTFEKPCGPFGPGPSGKSKPTVVESRPGAQRRAAAAAMAVEANRFEEGAVSSL
jgi:hypothetical protein